MYSKILRVPSFIYHKIVDINKYKSDIRQYISLCKADEKFLYSRKYAYPMLSDYRNCAGSIDMHYFLQDMWVAKQIIESGAKYHFDIGSRVDGFIAHLVSAGVNVNMIDIRPLGINVEGISFTQGDATDLTNIEENSIQSLSSLHVVEHFGLGRYGDKIDPKGWVKGLKSMQRIVAPGGYFYFSVPVGPKNKLCFNAHRIFEIHEPTKVLDQMELKKFSYIHNYSFVDVPLSCFDTFCVENDYSCGLYIFQKKL